MQSFIIVSKNKKIREEESLKICKENKIEDIDFNILSLDETASIGIEEIRNLQKRLFLKPIKSKIKAGILKNAENLTLASQNAMLKLLEEPPLNTILILESNTKEAFLPTVLSRCHLIEIEKSPKINSEEVDVDFALTFDLDNLSVSDKMKLAEKFGKTKETALNFLKKIILSIRKRTILEKVENLNSKILNILKSFQKTYATISSTNVNPRFSLENLFLSL